MHPHRQAFMAENWAVRNSIIQWQHSVLLLPSTCIVDQHGFGSFTEYGYSILPPCQIYNYSLYKENHEKFFHAEGIP